MHAWKDMLEKAFNKDSLLYSHYVHACKLQIAYVQSAKDILYMHKRDFFILNLAKLERFINAYQHRVDK